MVYNLGFFFWGAGGAVPTARRSFLASYQTQATAVTMPDP